jgi:hypothetical protein
MIHARLIMHLFQSATVRMWLATRLIKYRTWSSPSTKLLHTIIGKIIYIKQNAVADAPEPCSPVQHSQAATHPYIFCIQIVHHAQPECNTTSPNPVQFSASRPGMKLPSHPCQMKSNTVMGQLQHMADIASYLSKGTCVTNCHSSGT